MCNLPLFPVPTSQAPWVQEASSPPISFSTPPRGALQHAHVNSGICWHKDVKLEKVLCIFTFFSFGERQAWHRSQIPGFECVEVSEILHTLCPQIEEGNLTPKSCCQTLHEHTLVQRKAQRGAMQSLRKVKRGDLPPFQKGRPVQRSALCNLSCLSSW